MAIRKLATLNLILSVWPLLAQTPEEITRKQLAYTRKHYTKYEYKIPMRDGVKLFAAVYVPEEPNTAVPDFNAANAVFGRAVWH